MDEHNNSPHRNRQRPAHPHLVISLSYSLVTESTELASVNRSGVRGVRVTHTSTLFLAVTVRSVFQCIARDIQPEHVDI